MKVNLVLGTGLVGLQLLFTGVILNLFLMLKVILGIDFKS